MSLFQTKADEGLKKTEKSSRMFLVEKSVSETLCWLVFPIDAVVLCTTVVVCIKSTINLKAQFYCIHLFYCVQLFVLNTLCACVIKTKYIMLCMYSSL